MTYVDNRLNGKHFHWNPEGELVFEVDYIDGVAN
jgi:antitoxin component YwqK of YwqJK toxin-antitoxin module